MTSTMDCMVSRRCPICGRRLAETTPEGLCLVCLLEAGLAETASREGVESARPERSGSSRPRYFGDYEILREVGRGGMGVVYEARQFGTQRTVALKLLSAGAFASSDAVHRFHTEARAAARLDHPHIVPVYEAGLHDGQHFLAMRFMPGGTLAQWAQGRPIDPRRAAEIMRLLAQAIAYAHQHGVLHRDLKPGNVLLDENGEPHLADFGLARLSELEGGITLTSAILGTAPYMPPEQAAGGVGAATTAGDIYGLGAVLYEMLTGHPPFTGASVAEILRKVREEEPAAPLARRSEEGRGRRAEGRGQKSEVGVQKPGGGSREAQGPRSVVCGPWSRLSDLQTICLKCLEKEPAKRYATARDLADELERFLKDEPIVARPATELERIGRWCRRRPAIAGLSAALALAVLAGFAGTMWELQQARQHAAESQRQVARLHVLNGVNLLQDGDHFRSLLWFAEALTMNAEPPERIAIDRLRIAAVVAMGPRLASVITHVGQPVADAAFHPTKDLLATVGRDRRLRVWAIPTGELVFMTAPFDEPPSHVQFAPDGERLLVVSSEFNRVRLLVASNGDPLAGPMPHFAGGANNQPLRPRFDESGKLLLTQSASQTLQVWDARDASPRGRPIEIDAPIVWMNFSADGEKVLVRTLDGRTLVADWRTGKVIDLPTTPAELWFPSRKPEFGARSSVLGALDPLNVRRLDVSAVDGGSGRATSPRAPEDAASELGASGAPGGRALPLVPSREAHSQLARQPQPLSPPSSLPLSELAATLDKGVDQGTARGRDQATLDQGIDESWTDVKSLPRELRGATYDRDRKRLLTFGRDRFARLFDAATGAALLPPIEQPSLVENAVFSPDGTRFATVTAGGRTRVWSTDTGEPLTPPLDHSAAGGSVEFSANGRFLFTIHPAHAVFVWDLSKVNEPPVLLRPIALRPLAESGQDGSVFVTRDPNSPIRVRALAGAAEVSLHPSSLKMVPVQAWFDQTGAFIILEGERQRAQVWHAGTGLPVTSIFPSRYATNEADYRTVRLPARSEGRDQRSAVRGQRSEDRQGSAASQNLRRTSRSPTSVLGPPSSELRASSSELRALAELLSGSRLDGTGGWRPLELGEIVARWNRPANCTSE